MLNGKKIVVVMPAFNAEKTLVKTVSEIDRSIIDDIILVDDASIDNTVFVAEGHADKVICHDRNKGYGANQKTCYGAALERGADVVIMLHPDYQYTPKLLVPMAGMIAYGEYDAVMASRILGKGALQGGMPRYKYFSNRVLTMIENFLIGLKLSEYHSGYRAFSREVLLTLKPALDLNSDDFVFDNQMIVQIHRAGFRIGEISCPTRYQPESSSINFRRSVTYGIGVLKTAMQYRLERCGVARFPYLTACPRNAAYSRPVSPTAASLEGKTFH